jgi:hypothetical protein
MSNNIESITIYGFGPSFNPTRVDPSPFVQKVLAFASYNKIPYKLNAGPKPSPVASRNPWMKVIFKDSKNTKPLIVEDSQRCILELSKLFGIDMDSHLTADERVQSEALRFLIENTLYPSVVRSLWVDNLEWVRENYRLPLPDFMKSMVFNKIRSDQISFLNTHGNGDLSTEESRQVQALVVTEIARVLGNKKFLFSDDKPSLVDCYLSRYFDRTFENDPVIPQETKNVFAKYPQLAAYGKRIHKLFFEDNGEFDRLVKEGSKNQVAAKAKTTKIITGVLSGVVLIVGVAGYFGFKALKQAGYF